MSTCPNAMVFQMEPDSHIRIDKIHLGANGVQFMCGAPTDPPGPMKARKSELSNKGDGKIELTLGQGSHPSFCGDALNGVYKIDVRCKSKF